jgi:type I site-specific restriction-modification system R (restriction) subunit
MNVSITQAHKMTGVARSTIYKDMDEGKLSFTENGRGKRKIMISELQRVYGEVDPAALDKAPKKSESIKTPDNVVGVAGRSETTKTVSSDQIAVLQERILSLKSTVEDKDTFIEDLKSERQKSREMFEEQLDGMKKSLDKAQDGYNQITKLLEDKTGEGNGGWDKSIKALESRISNQEKAEKERQERERKLLDENKRIKHAYLRQKRELETEKNKGFFKKLFG